jgi:hypothetical protein
MIGLLNAPQSSASAAAAARWWTLNYLRHGIALVAWVAALKTFALFYQHGG